MPTTPRGTRWRKTRLLASTDAGSTPSMRQEIAGRHAKVLDDIVDFLIRLGLQRLTLVQCQQTRQRVAPFGRDLRGPFEHSRALNGVCRAQPRLAALAAAIAR